MQRPAGTHPAPGGRLHRDGHQLVERVERLLPNKFCKDRVLAVPFRNPRIGNDKLTTRRIRIAVQAGHALASYLLGQPFLSWDNGTLIYLGVKNERELLKWGEKLDAMDKKWAGFREPDIGNELTAIAAEDDGETFKRMRLL